MFVLCATASSTDIDPAFRRFGRIDHEHTIHQGAPATGLHQQRDVEDQHGQVAVCTRLTLAFLADLRGEESEALAAATSANFYALFNKAAP